MKKIITIVTFMLMGGMAHAAGGASASNVAVLESSITVRMVTVSSFTATDMTPASIEMKDRTMLVIQNEDTTYSLYCSGGVEVTSGHAFKLSPGGSISLSIRNYSQKFEAPLKIYCITAKTTGPTTASVVQAY